jgi:aryl-alcohol dehydrogenase-like predicted oxidoreductase
MVDEKTTRRKFLLTGIAAAGGMIGSSACHELRVRTMLSSDLLSSPTPISSNEAGAAVAKPPVQIPETVLGSTAMSLPILGLGGSASPLSRPDEENQAIAIIERAVELGIRYFDTAANYGPSEERLGNALSGERSRLLLASKTSARNRDEAWRDLEQSLRRLKTDYLDLWQFHALTYDWDLDTILDTQQGAIKAAEEAKQQGLIRFVGITGHHNPAIIAKGLRRYPFDTALIPVNAADMHTPQPFITGVLPIARQRQVGIIAMKVPAYGRLFKPGVLQGMGEAMGYALSQPGVHCCIIAANTIAQLEQNVEVAQAFKLLAREELVAIERRTTEVWQESSFFRNWA